MIEIQNLTKRYGASGITDVTFTCQPGTVTGFLGPNGAGKSTTMRVLTGLTAADSGTATIDGQRYVDLPDPGRRVGVLLDASAQHAGRTGRETLELSARILGVSSARASELLDLVGLNGPAPSRRVGAYSLGMRQRLALAHALLGEPDVLVLDEPANGLDPEGIHWMRGLLRNFADRGGTVLLSSHLLHEVQATADRLVIIGNGRIMADGTAGELLGGAGVVVRTLDHDALTLALADRGLRYTEDRDGALRVQGEAEAVGRAAVAAGAVLLELRDANADGLENLFLSLTGHTDERRLRSEQSDDTSTVSEVAA